MELATHRVRELRFDAPAIERDLAYIRRRDVKLSPLGEAFIDALAVSATLQDGTPKQNKGKPSLRPLHRR